ncbi:MAG: ATP-binding cassette domain-containing protein [Candidatus Aminicenantales bacterium]
MSGLVYRLKDIGYSYPYAPARFSLDLDSLEVPDGGILALVGPNGAGKTTLLMLLAFLLRPARGRLEFLGRDPWATDDAAVLARRDAVLLTHHPYLFKGTIGVNVAFGLKIRRLPEDEARARVRDALALVELEGWEGKPVSGLSAGQAQRAAIARALALRPRVLLLDEPTANLDAALGLRMEAVLREAVHAWGTTVVFSTHNFSQASRLADSILYLSDGQRVEFSHENCYSGTASTDGRTSWIEPKPGVRIVFPGETRGHVTCVIDPAAIRLVAAEGGGPVPSGPNVFRGRVSRMEAMDPDTALVRTSGDLVFRATLPLRALEAGGISLSREVLLTFEPGSVRVVGERPAEARVPS